MKLKYDTKSIIELKTKLKNRYPELTDSDLNDKNNEAKDMLTLVAYKLRKSKEEMNEIINNL